jgi:indole-3-glycerol phosphate synthase
MSLLARILDTKRQELAAGRHRRLPTPPVLRPVNLRRAPGEPLRILAEIKPKSPSAGQLSTRLSVSERATAYERGGSSMISVLCDHEFFGGSYENLTRARDACGLPLLCKEFVIDELQLDWARAFGADAVLLIVRCLEGESLAQLHAAAVARGLITLVEIASVEEARLVTDLAIPVIGVNARDLNTLEMNSTQAQNILHALPEAATRLHFSGIKSADDVKAVSHTGVDAALIGEVLMRRDDPLPLLTDLVQAAAG